MQFNVAHLLKGPVGTSQQHTLNVTFVPQEDIQIGHVSGWVRFMRVVQGIWVSGSLEATARCTCSRCLQEVPLSVQFQLDDIYFPLVDVTTGTIVGKTAADRATVTRLGMNTPVQLAARKQWMRLKVFPPA